MSGPSGAGSSNADGIVRNSSLSFLAHTQVSPKHEENDTEGAVAAPNPQGIPPPVSDQVVPEGVRAVCDACSLLYPEQPNPLQVTTRLKYWLGGHDPLDYISMYWNKGDPENNVPPHWHYISFGLSDLHGDGRVHPLPGSSPASGLGLELTFRAAGGPPSPPPLWPAAVLQGVARYLLTSGNKLYAGDHISWHCTLDGSPHIRHLLVTEDKQLAQIDTKHGTVAFLQLVGCTTRELRAAQRTSGFEVLKQIAEDANCGGALLVTDARRRSCRLRHVPAAPAHLAGVAARLYWTCAGEQNHEESSSEMSRHVQDQIKETLRRGLENINEKKEKTEVLGHMSTDSFEMSSMERALPDIPDRMQGSWRDDIEKVDLLSGVHIIMNAEAASLLPLAIDGRVNHGRHFTWRGVYSMTFLSPSVSGASTSQEHPYAAIGSWLQVQIGKELAKEMSNKFKILEKLHPVDSSDSESERDDNTNVSLPLTLSMPDFNIIITVVADDQIL